MPLHKFPISPKPGLSGLWWFIYLIFASLIYKALIISGAGEGTAIRASEHIQFREANWQEFDLSLAKN